MNHKNIVKRSLAFTLAAFMAFTAAPTIANAINNASADDGTQSYTATKVWNDNANESGKRPSKIQVALTKDNKKVEGSTMTLSNENNWSCTWNGLAKGKYSVVEDEVDGYTSNVQDMENGLASIITNSIIIDSDNAQDENKDDKNSETFNTGTADGTKKSKVDESDNTEKPETDTVQEEDKDDDSKSSELKDKTSSGDGADGQKETPAAADDENVNNENQETQTYTVEKTWNDDNNVANKRPDSVKVDLIQINPNVISSELNNEKTSVKSVHMSNGTYVLDVANSENEKDKEIALDSNEFKKIESVNLTNDSEWKHEWTNLEKGTYFVCEEDVDGYHLKGVKWGSDSSGAVLINEIDKAAEPVVPETTEFTVTKVWDDNNNASGIRPEEIKVSLTKDGKKVESENAVATLSEENNWSYTWTNLDDADYGVVEDEVDGYTSSVEAAENNLSAVVTNTITQEEEKAESVLETKGEDKTSEKNDSSDKKDESDTDKNSEKKKESDKVTKSDEKKTEEKISFKVTTKWDDKDDKHHDRPDSYTVSLESKGKLIGKEIELSKSNNWSYEWTELEKGDYDIKVGKIKYYTSKVEKSKDGTGAEIVNTYHEDSRKGGGDNTTKKTSKNTNKETTPTAVEAPKTGVGESSIFQCIAAIATIAIFGMSALCIKMR